MSIDLEIGRGLRFRAATLTTTNTQHKEVYCYCLLPDRFWTRMPLALIDLGQVTARMASCPVTLPSSYMYLMYKDSTE